MRAPEFWTRGGAVASALAPLGALYGIGVRLRRMLAHPFRPRARVVCIGNLTAGGTGKTPVAIAIARLLRERGSKPVLLTRGYGGRLEGPVAVDPAQHTARDVGDEALLLAAAAPAIVARDRAAGARLADAMGAEIIVMDDGHQNFSVTKDVSLLVIDAETGLGNGRLIPAGPLREPARAGCARADALVLMGEGMPALPPFAGPILRSRLEAVPPAGLAGRRVLAFAGIGRPEKFFRTLMDLGCDLAEAHPFADHHVFSAAEVAALKARARALGVPLVTTEKDFLRLDPEMRDDIVALPARTVFAEPAMLNALLDRVRRDAPPSARP